MPGFIGVPELIVLGVVLLLVFGPKRLPEMGTSLGRGLREFKESVSTDARATDAEEGPKALPPREVEAADREEREKAA